MSEERTCRNCAYAVEEWSPKYEENLLFCHCEGMPRDVSFTRRFHGKFCCNQWKPKDGVSGGLVRNADELKARLTQEMEEYYQKWGFLTPEAVMGMIEKHRKEEG